MNNSNLISNQFGSNSEWKLLIASLKKFNQRRDWLDDVNIDVIIKALSFINYYDIQKFTRTKIDNHNIKSSYELNEVSYNSETVHYFDTTCIESMIFRTYSGTYWHPPEGKDPPVGEVINIEDNEGINSDNNNTSSSSSSSDNDSDNNDNDTILIDCGPSKKRMKKTVKTNTKTLFESNTVRISKLVSEKALEEYKKRKGYDLKTFDELKLWRACGFSEKQVESKLQIIQTILIPVCGPNLPHEIYGSYISQKPAEQNNHWSLLCYYRPTNKVYYYDPLGTYNIRRAKNTLEYFQLLRIIPGDCEFIIPDFTVTQPGNWQCGYYVIMYIFMILVKNPTRPLSTNDIKERYASYFGHDLKFVDLIIDIIHNLLIKKNKNYII
jgi:hypothetical protein